MHQFRVILCFQLPLETILSRICIISRIEKPQRLVNTTQNMICFFHKLHFAR